MRDPYSVLGVKRDAEPDEIKAAWRNIAKAVHPDQNRDDPNATIRFAEIGQAYDVLKDPKKRSRYDQERRMAEIRKREQTIQQQRDAAREANARAKAAQANAERMMEELARAEKAKAQAGGAPQPASAESAEDMISRIFGAPPGAAAPKTDTAAGAATEAAAGNGDAAAPAADPHAAKAHALPLPLQAVDLLASLVRRIRGIQPAPEKAPDTPVEATVTIEDLLAEKWVTVTLPEGRDVRFHLEAGILEKPEGLILRLKGQGLKLQGMQRGDVTVTLRVDQSGLFQLKGANIHSILPVTLENAVLGCETMADAPDGAVPVTVPAWSGSDQAIRIPGRGLPRGDGGRGDLVVEVRLMLWEKPDEKVTDLMRSMREGLFL